MKGGFEVLHLPGNIDLHGRLGNFYQRVLDRIGSFCLEPLQHFRQMPDSRTSLVNWRWKQRSMPDHQLPNILTAATQDFGNIRQPDQIWGRFNQLGFGDRLLYVSDGT